MKKRRIFSFMLIMAMLSNVMPIVFAWETEINGDFEYIKDTNIVYRYIGTSSNLIFPDGVEVSKDFKYGGGNVKTITIGKNIKYDATPFSTKSDVMTSYEAAIKEVTFEEGVEEIPEKMFQGYRNITKINFPSTLKKIGNDAFSFPYALSMLPEGSGMKIKDLYIPDSVIEIGDDAFYGCENLGKVHISENVEIMDGFGIYCHAETVNVPRACAYANYYYNKGFVIRADEYTFDKMDKYMFQTLAGKAWMREKYLKELPDSYIEENKGFMIIDGMLCAYLGTDRNPVIPSEVQELANYAFYETDIDSVTLNDNIKKISNRCFMNSSISSIEIPSSVEEISSVAFNNTKIKKLVIPKTVKKFYNFGIMRELEELTIEGNPEVITGLFVQFSKLTPETLHILDDNFKIDCEWFWEEQQLAYDTPSSPNPVSSATPTVKPTIKPTTKPTVTPTATAVATEKPDATQTPTAVPTATEEPQESINVAIKGGEIEITSNNEKVKFPDEKPFVDESERTQIPIRALAEMLDFDVDWDGENLSAILKKGDTTITIKIGSNEIRKNREKILMDTTAKVINDRTYIPLRYISEALGYKVAWLN